MKIREFQLRLKFVPNGPINNIPALVQIMAWRLPGDPPLSDPMMVVSLLTHICVIRPQWINGILHIHYMIWGQCMVIKYSVWYTSVYHVFYNANKVAPYAWILWKSYFLGICIYIKPICWLGYLYMWWFVTTNNNCIFSRMCVESWF